MKKIKENKIIYGIRIIEILPLVLIINNQELSHLFLKFNVPKRHLKFFLR